MNWSDLSMSQRSELMSIYLKNGITSLDEMKKHYNSFAEGGLTSPDHDPNNPYHYHVNGQKVVVTPEDWEKYKNDPTFREVRAAVEAEQAAYPKPEYDEIENPAWRKAYQNLVNGVNLRGRDNVSQPLPQGYTRDNKGVVMDASGNYYIPKEQVSNVPYFINQERGMFGNTVPIRYEQQQMPDRTIRKLRQPLPVDRVMNIGEEREKAINNYITDNTKNITSQATEYEYAMPIQYYYTPYEGGRFNKVSKKKGAPKQLVNITGSFYNPQTKQYEYENHTRVVHSQEEYDRFRNEIEKYEPKYYGSEEDLNSILLQYNPDVHSDEYVDRYNKGILDYANSNKRIKSSQRLTRQVRPSRQEAESNAVIKVGDLEKLGTFAKGGKLDIPPERFFGIATPEVTDNNIYYSRNSLLPEVNITAKGDPRKIDNDYYKAHAAERVAFEDRVARREGYEWLNPMNLIEYTPIVGDAIDAAHVINDAANRNYLSAGVGAGMFLLPNIIEKPLKSTARGFKNTLKNYNPNLLPKDLNSPLYLSHTITGEGLKKVLLRNTTNIPAPSIGIATSGINKNPNIIFDLPSVYDGKYTFYFKPDYIDNMEHFAKSEDMFSPTWANAETYKGRTLTPEEVIATKKEMLERYGTLTDLQNYIDFETGDYIYPDSKHLQNIIKREHETSPTLNNARTHILKYGQNRVDYHRLGEVMPLDLVDLGKASLVIGGGSTSPIISDFMKNLNFYERGKIYPNNIYDIPGLAFKDGGKIFIKPENRGKFTALKKRTGHSASWFKENGTPAQRKMAVFELNSKKWRK